MKNYLTIIFFFFLSLAYSQRNDTLLLYEKSLQIVKLYKDGNSNRLLQTYRKSEGPKYITEDKIKKEISFYDTKKIEFDKVVMDSVGINFSKKHIPKTNDSKAINSKYSYFEFKFSTTNINYKLDYFYITVAFSKWWYENEAEPLNYDLYFISIGKQDRSGWGKE